jgi:enterochelin esterase-like enzyme
MRWDVTAKSLRPRFRRVPRRGGEPKPKRGPRQRPNTKQPEELVPNLAEAARRLKLLWVSCGDNDGLIYISQRTHRYLKERNVPHVWHVDSGGHDFTVWRNDLYLVAQRIFR